MADELTTKRIINLPAESAPDSGDVLVVDNQSNGTKKLPVSYFQNEINSKIAKPTESPDGENGQLLRTNGDGTTEWTDAGAPTDEQVGAAVSEWLDEHPEATATVDFSVVTKVYDNVAAMAADTTLKTDDNVLTKGYYTLDDNGGARYQVGASHNGVFYISLENGLYANRIDENSAIKAESIGIKAYRESVENPVQDDMDNNVTIANLAVYNGIRIVFGKGYFYFSSAIQLARKNTYTLRGIDRDLSVLVFPSSDGLYFCDPIYYNYYVITGLKIISQGHCIRCAENCLTVLDSHFEWLSLQSETGDCFHAPDYNVAKYTNQSGNIIYDTCVQNCVFDFINAQASQGAAFANIMGMYSQYKHMNLVSCLYGFRNCDGIIEQLNTLGTSILYFIYYDKANSHSLRWSFRALNAEGLSGAFIYTEPQVNIPSGEDPRKPQTANIMTIETLLAVDSGFSLRGVDNVQKYPITAHAINNITLINSGKIVSPNQYPGSYDTNVVNANILFLRGTRPSFYGGSNEPSITIKSGNNIFEYAAKGNTAALTPTIVPYTSFNAMCPPKYDAIYVPRIFGGKAQDAYILKASDLNGSGFINSLPDEHLFCDSIVITVDQSSDKSISGFLGTKTPAYPGRIVTFTNHKDSQANVVLKVNGGVSFSVHTSHVNQITIPPGECVHFVLTYDRRTSDNAMTMTWKAFLASDNTIIA